MKLLRTAIILFCTFAALVFATPAPSASAHPLGNFTINRYSRIEVSSARIRIHYVLDMAEIPTFQEMSVMDANHDGKVDDGEHDGYLRAKVEQLRQALSLRADGASLALKPSASQLTFPAGQGGLATTRIVINFDADMRASLGAHQLDYRDDNYGDRLGWKEIVLRADGVSLTRSSVPSDDRSAELTRYPDDMLSSPLDVREAHAAFDVAASEVSANPSPIASAPAPNILDRSRDQLAELIATQELSVTVIAFSLLTAFGLGALHALSPGHGKTIVGAYLVGSRGTAKHALFLGLTVTLTHTVGVFALGLITLFASQFILPEQLYPWLSLMSGVLVVAIGLSLFTTRLRHFAQHQFARTHAHSHEHTHDHSPDENVPLSWRNLLALGISGGLLPCPSALVVLLGAIALHRVAFGLILIVAFSMGLAGVLTAIGWLLVYAGRFVARARVPSRVMELLPVGSALVVTMLGVIIAAQALLQVGWLRL